ncbi:hypothetical protein GCM10022247_62630 [Allokutzneria multivorans]|uniref:Nucleotidyl transferase AbiEii/AbiGii toxin family protein n=1 Tax=Allokutzneria multivorans TaxID=1142134 RepID=A0ABP7TP50_9PSEU
MSSALTGFQADVARLFFGLPASQGFLLAGGAALITQELIVRPTEDLDFFTTRAPDVVTARDALEAAVAEQGWSSRRARDGATFVRLEIIGPERVLVDLALDSAPGSPAVVTVIGPSFAPEELAGRKLVALFDRAEARDFTDVHALAERYGKAFLLRRAAEVDQGFDERVLAEMFRFLPRWKDDDLPVPPDEVGAVREFFADWARELEAPAE